MNRKLIGAVAALVVAFVAVWFFWLRDRGHDGKAPPKQARTKLELPKPTQKPDDTPAPKGMAPRWSLDLDPEGPLRLEGQVVDDDGKPVGNADVWLSSVPPRSTKSEADGGFAFDKLVGRKYSLSATAGDLVGRLTNFNLSATSDPVVVRVGPGAKLIVSVAAEDGKPIDGADVKLAAEERTARTGADGNATIKPVNPGWVSVQVTASGYAPGSSFTQIGSAGATGQVKVTLHKGMAVSGRVIDETGKPIAKARISTAALWEMSAGIEPAVTDTKGQFTIPALPPGSHTLVATDGEHAPGKSAPVTIANRAVANIEIVMKEGGVIAGVVVDEGGKAVPFATVRVIGNGQMWMTAARQATSDKSGAFEVRGLARMKLQARAESDAAASKIENVDLTQEAARKGLRLLLDVKGTISGIVVDETGAPVPEVQVNAFPDLLGGASSEGLALAGMSSATTDGAGAFAVRGLPDGAYRLWAARSTSGQREWGEQGSKAKTGDKGVKITLAAPGKLTGTIALENGNAPKFATVVLGHHPNTPAAADGAFKLTDLAPGKYDLHIYGAEFAEFVKRDVEIKAGATTDLGKLTVMRGRKLTGRVIDASGSPVSGAKVKVGDMLFSAEGGEEQIENFEQMYGAHSAMSDQDGRFTLIGIAKKRTNVMADHPTRGRSYALSIADGVDDPPPITLALRGFGSVTGKVTSKGQPVGGATVTDSPKGGGQQIQIAETHDDGTFALTKVSEGPHVLSAMQQSSFGMSLKSTSVTVQVTAGRETKATIDIPVGALTLAVQVKAAANQKVDSAQVFLFRGILAAHTAKELTDSFLGGGVQGMKFWWGEGKPLPEFDELVGGDYSICTVPITGDLSDTTFATRIQEHKDELKVYCKSVKLAGAPAKQTFVHEVPAMTPLPTN